MGLSTPVWKRRVDVYAQSLEMKQRWRDVAAEAGMTLSNYMMHMMELSLEQEVLGTDRQTLLDSNEILSERLHEAEDLVRALEALRDKQDKDLLAYRAQPFANQDFRGLRQLDRRLVELLKSRTSRGKQVTIPFDRLLHEMGVQPDEHKIIQALSAQLDAFVDYELVEYTNTGYRWCG